MKLMHRMRDHAPPGRAVADSEEMSREEFHPKSVLCALFFVLCTCLTVTCSRVKRTKYKGQSTKFNLWRIKQTRPLLAGLDSKMLISELGRHPASRRTIKEADS